MHTHAIVHPRMNSNPTTGETMLVEVGAPAAGESRILFTLPPRQSGPPPHFHDAYDETFEVVDGELTLTIAGTRSVLRAGDRLVVRRGVVHAFWNASDQSVAFRTTASQGAGFERFIRGWYGLALAGRSRARGPRSVFELVVLLHEGDVNLPWIPLAIQRAIRRVVVALARRRGAARIVETAIARTV